MSWFAAAAMLVAAAPTQAADDLILGCDGQLALRVVRSAAECFTFEHLVTWPVNGIAGPEGPAGLQGPLGPRGPHGLTGPQGPEGAAGAAGSLGPAGATGSAGSAGLQGTDGFEGAAGGAGTTGADGPRGSTGARGPRGHGFEVIDASDQVIGTFLFNDANMGTTMVARTSGAATYSLIVHPYKSIAPMNGVNVLFRGSSCEGPQYAFDPVAYGALLPPPAGFGPDNEVFAADTSAPIVQAGTWTESGGCSADEDLSTWYLLNGPSTACETFSWCGPMRPLKSMGILDAAPPFTIRVP